MTRTHLRRLRDEEQGQSMIVMVLILGVLVMALTIGVNVSRETRKRIQLQSVADSAALSAANTYLRAEDTQSIIVVLAASISCTQVVYQGDWLFMTAMGYYFSNRRRSHWNQNEHEYEPYRQLSTKPFHDSTSTRALRKLGKSLLWDAGFVVEQDLPYHGVTYHADAPRTGNLPGRDRVYTPTPRFTGNEPPYHPYEEPDGPRGRPYLQNSANYREAFLWIRSEIIDALRISLEEASQSLRDNANDAAIEGAVRTGREGLGDNTEVALFPLEGPVIYEEISIADRLDSRLRRQVRDTARAVYPRRYRFEHHNRTTYLEQSGPDRGTDAENWYATTLRGQVPTIEPRRNPPDRSFDRWEQERVSEWSNDEAYDLVIRDKDPVSRPPDPGPGYRTGSMRDLLMLLPDHPTGTATLYAVVQRLFIEPALEPWALLERYLFVGELRVRFRTTQLVISYEGLEPGLLAPSENPHYVNFCDLIVPPGGRQSPENLALLRELFGNGGTSFTRRVDGSPNPDFNSDLSTLSDEEWRERYGHLGVERRSYEVDGETIHYLFDSDSGTPTTLPLVYTAPTGDPEPYRTIGEVIEFAGADGKKDTGLHEDFYPHGRYRYLGHFEGEQNLYWDRVFLREDESDCSVYFTLLRVRMTRMDGERRELPGNLMTLIEKGDFRITIPVVNMVDRDATKNAYTATAVVYHPATASVLLPRLFRKSRRGDRVFNPENTSLAWASAEVYNSIPSALEPGWQSRMGTGRRLLEILTETPSGTPLQTLFRATRGSGGIAGAMDSLERMRNALAQEDPDLVERTIGH